MLKRGLVQIYTGDGKGKTTAALGLALRAAGHANKVLICQFLKPASLKTGERIALQSSGLPITIQALDVPWDMQRSFDNKQAVANTRNVIVQKLTDIARDAAEKAYDVIILDEIVFCLVKGLAKLKDIKNIIDNKDGAVEIVLTGRGATEELIGLADVVTEMKAVKHPYDKGIAARQGIEY